MGAESFFEKFIGASELDYILKPDVKAFEKTLELTGYHPEKTLFVDDVPEFHEGAKKTGLKTVLVSSDVKREYIDYNIRNIYELEKLLEDLK